MGILFEFHATTSDELNELTDRFADQYAGKLATLYPVEFTPRQKASSGAMEAS